MYIPFNRYFNITNFLEMKDYFKRLKEHPGLVGGSIFTIGCFLAAFGNKNMSSEAALITGSIASLFIWTIILTTVRRK